MLIWLCNWQILSSVHSEWLTCKNVKLRVEIIWQILQHQTSKNLSSSNFGAQIVSCPSGWSHLRICLTPGSFDVSLCTPGRPVLAEWVSEWVRHLSYCRLIVILSYGSVETNLLVAMVVGTKVLPISAFFQVILMMNLQGCRSLSSKLSLPAKVQVMEPQVRCTRS